MEKVRYGKYFGKIYEIISTDYHNTVVLKTTFKDKQVAFAARKELVEEVSEKELKNVFRKIHK